MQDSHHPFLLDLEGPCFIMCTEAPGPGGGGGGHDFPWTLLLIKALKKGRPVAIISANHNREHFAVVLRRHGLDASRLEVAGLLQIQIVSFDGFQGWEEILENYAALSLFIDDLEALEAVTPSSVNSSYYRTFISSMFAKLHEGRLETLVAYGRCSDASLDDNDVTPTLTEFCKHRAQVVIHVEPLSSGRSHEAHGIVTIKRPLVSANGREERYTFKIGSGSKDEVTFHLRR